MTSRFCDGVAVMKPVDHWPGICLDPTFEQEPLAVILLSDGGFLGEGRCEPVDLSAQEKDRFRNMTPDVTDRSCQILAKAVDA